MAEAFTGWSTNWKYASRESGGQFLFQRFRAPREQFPLALDAIRFLKIHHAESAWLQQFRLSPAIVLRVFAKVGLRSRGACCGPNSRAAQSFVNSAIFSFGQRSGSHAIVRKNSMGNSIGFRSPTFTIQMRSAPYSIRQIHLFPDFGKRIGVDPFVIARPADVIEVVVNARAAAARALLRESAGGGYCPSCRRTRAASHRPARACPSRSSPALLCRAPSPAGRCVRSGFMCSAMILRWSATIFSSSATLALSDIGLSPSPRMPKRDDAFVVLVAFDALRPELAQDLGVFRRSPTGRCRGASIPAARASSARDAMCP